MFSQDYGAWGPHIGARAGPLDLAGKKFLENYRVPYPTVRWSRYGIVVGGGRISGRATVALTSKQSTAYLSDPTTSCVDEDVAERAKVPKFGFTGGNYAGSWMRVSENDPSTHLGE